VENVPLGENTVFVTFNTGVTHSLVAGEYNERRESCERAAKNFNNQIKTHPVTFLRDVTWEEWEKFGNQLDDHARMRAAHIISENERVAKGSELLHKGELTQFGDLMFKSHLSSKNDFQNSCLELDLAVEAARESGALGARLSGGGFGGSIVALTTRNHANHLIESVISLYEKKTSGKKLTSLLIIPSNGAHVK